MSPSVKYNPKKLWTSNKQEAKQINKSEANKTSFPPSQFSKVSNQAHFKTNSSRTSSKLGHKSNFKTNWFGLQLANFSQIFRFSNWTKNSSSNSSNNLFNKISGNSENAAGSKLKNKSREAFFAGKNRQNRTVYPGQASSNQMKVFAPKPSTETIAESITENIISKVLHSKKSKFSFGFKSTEYLKPQAFAGLASSWQKEFKLWLIKIQLIPRLNALIGMGSLVVLLLFFFYLCFFDTNFIVKNYQINFTNGSYISNEDMAKIVQSVKDAKLLGIVPNNQYWFLNSQNLTASMSKYEPQIREVKVIDRIWPDKAILEITTEPILLTLGINTGEYWRVSQEGRIISKDEAGLREKLVVVERPISLNRSGLTLKNYSFKDDLPQLNRFWFINWLWKLLGLLNYKVVSTSLPSLFDTDITITLDSGTKLYFDSSALAQDSQKKRIETVLDSKYRSEINLGQINYLDFRISRKVFVCLQNRECSNVAVV